MAAAVPFLVVGNTLSSVADSNAQKGQLENQAAALDARADDIRTEGSAEEVAIRGRGAQIEGNIIASAAGSGVDVSTGSVLDVIKENAFNIEMDALTARQNAEKQAVATRQGAADTRAAKPSGLSTLLSAGGAAASGYAMGSSLAGSFGGKG